MPRAPHLSNRGKLAVVAGLAAVGAVIGITDEDTTPPPATDVTAKWEAAKAHARELVRARLKDPRSAEFSELTLKWVEPPTVCGWVNARNSFGGFTGPEPFLVLGPMVMMRQDGEREFVRMWNRTCAGDAEPNGSAR